MTFRAPVTKPYGVAPSPYMAQGAAKGLWKDLAFIAPLQSKAQGQGVLLNQWGRPLGKIPTVNGPEWRGSPYGLGVGRVAGTSDQRILRFTGNLITTSDGSGTGDFTMVVLANPKLSTDRKNVYTQRINASSQGGLAFNSSAAGGSSQGAFTCFTYSGANTSAFTTNAIDGKYHLFGGTRRGTTISTWIDGVLRDSTSGTLRNINNASNESVIGGNGGESLYGIDDDTTVVFVAGWNRALRNFEMMLLGIDPFCMFRPAPVRKVINTVAAGGTAVPVFMHHYMQQRAA